MRSLLKISLAVLAVGFLVVSGSAFAQDMAKPTMTITGNVGTAFGQFNYDKLVTGVSTLSTNEKAFSEYVTTWESNIRFTWQTDSFQVISRARIRMNIEGDGISPTGQYGGGATYASGSSFASSADDWYNEVWWTPGAFKLGIGKFQGQAWSQPFSGEYIILNPIDVAAGASEYWMNWTGIAGLDAEYNLGMIQLGVAVSSQCKPSCGPGNTNNTTTALQQETNTQSIVPHLAGASGPISFRLQVPMASGDYNACIVGGCDKSAAFAAGGSAKTLTGSGLQAGVGFSQSGLYVAADYGTFTDDNSAALYLNSSSANFGLIKARSRTSESVRVDIPAGPGSINVGYFTQDDNQPAAGVVNAPGASGPGLPGKAIPSSHTYTNTITTVRYNIPTSFGTITPEYRAAVFGGGQTDFSADWTQGGKNKDLSDNEIRVIFNGNF